MPCNTHSWVYVIKTRVPDNKIGYYVGVWGGYTLETRIQQHFSGNGSRFTKKYKPIAFIKVGYFRNGFACRLENKLTVRYLKKVGFRWARGGNYLNMRPNCHQLPQLRWWLPHELLQDLEDGKLGVPDPVEAIQSIS